VLQTPATASPVVQAAHELRASVRRGRVDRRAVQSRRLAVLLECRSRNTARGRIALNDLVHEPTAPRIRISPRGTARRDDTEREQQECTHGPHSTRHANRSSPEFRRGLTARERSRSWASSNLAFRCAECRVASGPRTASGPAHSKAVHAGPSRADIAPFSSACAAAPGRPVTIEKRVGTAHLTPEPTRPTLCA
jgi:hypothetical protein